MIDEPCKNDEPTNVRIAPTKKLTSSCQNGTIQEAQLSNDLQRHRGAIDLCICHCASGLEMGGIHSKIHFFFFHLFSNQTSDIIALCKCMIPVLKHWPLPDIQWDHCFLEFNAKRISHLWDVIVCYEYGENLNNNFTLVYAIHFNSLR